MNTFKLTVTTPDGNVLDAQAEGLYLRGESGDLAVLAGHAPFVTSVKPCELHIDMQDSSVRAKVTGGLLNVSNSGGESRAVLITPSFDVSE